MSQWNFLVSMSAQPLAIKSAATAIAMLVLMDDLPRRTARRRQEYAQEREPTTAATARRKAGQVAAPTRLTRCLKGRSGEFDDESAHQLLERRVSRDDVARVIGRGIAVVHARNDVGDFDVR